MIFVLIYSFAVHTVHMVFDGLVAAAAAVQCVALYLRVDWFYGYYGNFQSL